MSRWPRGGRRMYDLLGFFFVGRVVHIFIQTDTQADRQTDGGIDRQTDRPKDRQSRQTDGRMDGQTDC